MVSFKNTAVYQCAFLALVLLNGCASISPSERETELALPKADSDIWYALAATRDGGWMRLLNQGEEALEWRIRLLDSATTSVDFETFLWKPDPVGYLVLSRLLAAADRGARIRLLLDDSFTMHEDKTLHALAEHQNIELRIYNPNAIRSGGAALRELLNIGDFGRINHRMHNKSLTVDGRSTIIGGRNIADEYFGYDPKYNFRDMEVLVVGETAADASRHFDIFWNSPWVFPIEELAGSATQSLAELHHMSTEFAIAGTSASDKSELLGRWKEAAAVGLSGDAQLIYDKPAEESPAAKTEQPVQVAKTLIDLVNSANSELILVSAYLIPTMELEQAIAEALLRGVRVRILTNSLRSNNHLAAQAAYEKHIRHLLAIGAELHELKTFAGNRDQYINGEVVDKRLGLHAKVMIVDSDRAFIGSCNLDPRSLNLNTEVGLVISSLSINRALRGALAPDFLAENSWSLQLANDGRILWRDIDQLIKQPPADSTLQRIEDWFLGLLPIEAQM